MKPKRIQLSRAKGWRLPDGAVNVARPTRWGNPFKVGDEVGYHGSSETVGYYGRGFTCWYDQTIVGAGLSAEQAVAMYRSELTFALDPAAAENESEEYGRLELVAALETLRGHDLACWCPPGQPCHADVLLDLANR